MFRRDAVTQGFIPRQGDWIMLKLQDEYDEVIVSDVNCLREKSVSGTVEWFSGLSLNTLPLIALCCNAMQCNDS